MKRIALLVLPALLAGACTTCDLDAVARSAQEKRAAFTIVLGEGGGIRGTWAGHTITGDGAVAAWEGRGARENEHEAGTLPADTLCALWDAAKALAPSANGDTGGSLVRYLRVTMGDTIRTYSWTPRLGAGSPPAYQRFSERCAAAIRTATIITPTTTPSTK